MVTGPGNGIDLSEVQSGEIMLTNMPEGSSFGDSSTVVKYSENYIIKDQFYFDDEEKAGCNIKYN